MDKKSLNKITAAVTALIMTAGMTFPVFAEEQGETVTASAPEEKEEGVAESSSEDQKEGTTESSSEGKEEGTAVPLSEEQKEEIAESSSEGKEEEITESVSEDPEAEEPGAEYSDPDSENTSSDEATWKFDEETKTLTVSGNGVAELSFSAPDPDWKEKVETAVIENGVTGLGEGFFGGCNNLKNVSIPDSVTCIDGAFYKCTSLKTITLPDSIYSLCLDTFAGCTALEEVHLGNQMQRLGMGISVGEFNGCTSLERINLPDSLYSITRDTFKGCTSLKEIIIPDHVDSIDEGVFKDCTSLTDVTLGSGVRYIHNDAFKNCESLEKIEIPKDGYSIGENAFSGCKKLKEVTVLSEECIIEDNSFEGCDPSLVIRAYKGSKAEKYAERNGFAFEALQKKMQTEEEREEEIRRYAEAAKEREEAELKRAAEEQKQQTEDLIKSLTDEGMRGDITGDGAINVFDVMRYKKSIIEGNNADLSDKTDINRDGTLGGGDVSSVKSDVLGASVLWSYGTMPKMESDTFSGTLESMFRSSMLGLNYSTATKLVSDDNGSDKFGKLVSGDTDLVFTDAVTEEQKKAAAEAGLKLNIVPVAKSALVFIVNKSNPVDSLTSEQIKDIYSGKITNWKEVGGNDELIVSFQRNDNSDSQRFINKWMNGMKLTEPLKIGDVNSEYKNLENAIGFTCYSNAAQMGEALSDIKYLSVDGVKPSEETMSDGTYPVLSDISVVYTDKAAQNTRNFAEWVLSEEGQKAVADSGCIPVKKTEQKVRNKLYTAKGTGREKPADLVPDWNGYNIFLREIEGHQKLTWKDGMPKTECGITCLKDKDIQEKINADIRNVMFGDKDSLPGEWKMKGEVYNAYINIIFGKKGSDTETTSLIYDLRDGSRLEKFSDLFYKDADFLPLLNRLLAREAAKNEWDIFVTDYFGLSDDITYFDFNGIILGENNPYAAGTLYLSLQNDLTRELMGNMVISEHVNSHEFFDVMFKSSVRLTEWYTNEWIEDYSYGKDGKLHYDFISYYHTPEEIEERNRYCDQVAEKTFDLFVKEFPDAAGKLRIDKKNNVFIEDTEAQLRMSSVNAYRAYIALSGYPNRFYCFDHDTMERLSVSDILGKNFEAYNDKYIVDTIDLREGTVVLNSVVRNVEGSSWETLNIDPDGLNMKYVRQSDAFVTECSGTKYGVVDSENAFVYPESYVVEHDTEKKGEPVQKGNKFEIRKFTESFGKTWYECWNAENGEYFGWIAKDNIIVQYTEDQNKLKYTSFEEDPIQGKLLTESDRIVAQETPQDVICYTNESVMDANSELEESVVSLNNRYVEARSKCLSHGKWLYECWSRSEYIGWVEMHDFEIGEKSLADHYNYPEKLDSERTGTVPGEKYNGIDFYASRDIVEDTLINRSAGMVTKDIKIQTNKRCEFHGEWWYECLSADGEKYFGWVNGDLIEFE